MSWRDLAACAGKPVEWFFPGENINPQHAYKLGKAVCASCPVVLECAAEHRRAERETGLQLPGLWAGLTDADRRNRRPRLNERRNTPRICVVCTSSFPDSGRGMLPRFCSEPCTQRAHYRRSIQAPESDRDFEVWKLYGKVGA